LGEKVSNPDALDLSPGIYNGLTLFSEQLITSGFSNDGISIGISINELDQSPSINGTVTLAEVFFAVDVPEADFSLQVLGSDNDPSGFGYVFSDDNLNEFAFTGSSASLQVVPEPQTIGGALFAVVLSVGWRMKRRFVEPRGDSALSC